MMGVLGIDWSSFRKFLDCRLVLAGVDFDAERLDIDTVLKIYQSLKAIKMSLKVFHPQISSIRSILA